MSATATTQKPARRRRGQKHYSAEERAQYREQKHAEAREAIEASARELLTSEGWQRWAQTRARFRRYSFANTLMIAMQCPGTTYVCGFRQWEELGRHVVKGEKALRIWAPVKPSKAKLEEYEAARKRASAEAGTELEGEAPQVRFRLVPVFDVSQTEGEPLPVPECEPITGDSHARYLAPLTAYAARMGYTVEEEQLSEGHGGYCDLKAHRIVLAADWAPNRKVRTLVHELAHAHGVDYESCSRGDAEVIVETAAMIVCGSIGLDTSGESVPYVAGWGEASDVEAIRKHAATVDEIARKIEDACGELEVIA